MATQTVEQVVSSSWWSEFLAVKDTLSWADLQKRFGVPAATLRKAMESVGATKHPLPAGRKAKHAAPAVAAPAKPAPVEASAVSSARPTAAERLAAFHDRMGKEADGVIAKEAGIDRRHVVDYRKKHGIGAYDGFRQAPKGSASSEAAAPVKAAAKGVSKAAAPPAAAKFSAPKAVATKPTPAAEAPKAAAKSASRGRPGPRASKLDSFRERLGSISDNEIAKLAGVSAEAVRQYRIRHGIPGVSAARPAAPAPAPAPAATSSVVAVAAEPKRRGRPPKSVAAAKAVAPAVLAAPAASVPVAEPAVTASAPVSTGAAQAFAVVASRGAERQRFIVLGTSIADAAASAARVLSGRGADWSVRSIRHLCEALS